MTKVAAFGGSLRHDAHNTKLLLAAARLAPEDVEMSVVDIRSLPLYNPDHDEELGGDHYPAPARELRDTIADADALLIVSPEYNWSVPGYVKNAIDWVSRPAMQSVLAGKPTLLMGTSGGPAGTGRAQLHLRQILLSTRTPVLIESLELPHAREHFDDEGRLDEETSNKVSRLLERLVEEAGLASERRLAQAR